MERCNHCDFWDQLSDHPDMGKCMLDPPTVLWDHNRGKSVSQYPLTRTTAGCSQHIERSP